MKAQVIPYSSVVGGGVMLLDEAGRAIGQLALLNIQSRSKDEYLAMCQKVVDAINHDQVVRQVKHYKNDEKVYDVVTDDGLFQVSTPNSCTRVVQDQDRVTIYRGPEGRYFVRFPDEVVEPRFTEVGT